MGIRKTYHLTHFLNVNPFSHNRFSSFVETWYAITRHTGTWSHSFDKLLINWWKFTYYLTFVFRTFYFSFFHIYVHTTTRIKNSKHIKQLWYQEKSVTIKKIKVCLCSSVTKERNGKGKTKQSKVLLCWYYSFIISFNIFFTLLYAFNNNNHYNKKKQLMRRLYIRYINN